jgi:hypothetical protein
MTAEPMVDWMKQSVIDVPRNESFFLRICSHIANAGKHFIADKITKDGKEIHVSFNSARYDGVFEPGVFEEVIFEDPLRTELTPEEAKELGVEAINAVSPAS